MKRVKAVLPQHEGELLIETPSHLWDETLRAWQNDPSRPIPMPVGHAVFRDPEGCGFEDVSGTWNPAGDTPAGHEEEGRRGRAT